MSIMVLGLFLRSARTPDTTSTDVHSATAKFEWCSILDGSSSPAVTEQLTPLITVRRRRGGLREGDGMGL